MIQGIFLIYSIININYEMKYNKTNYRMSKCTKKDTQVILNEVENLLPNERTEALKFIDKVSDKGICRILHGLRRFYMGGSATTILLEYSKFFKYIYKTKFPKNLYRGFKIYRNPKHQDSFRDSALQNVEKGDIVEINVVRNGGIASFTESIKIANRFSGKSKEKMGIVIKLLEAKNGIVLIAPPHATKNWFNKLYAATMGKSFRENEIEWLIYSPKIKVKIVDVKK